METIPWEVSKEEFSDAYVAGFFDGDGSLVATLEKLPSKYSRTYRPRIKMNFTQHMKHVYMLHALQKYLCAGTVRVAKSHDLAELVIVDREQVRNLLERLIPHLILKRRQALLGQEVIRLLGQNSKLNRISSLNYKQVLKHIAEIRNLNAKTGGKKIFFA